MSRKEKKGKEGMKRRDFLKVLGVVGGTAAVAGSCSEPVEQIIPYVIPPENVIPGVPKFYATTCRECSSGCGLVVKTCLLYTSPSPRDRTRSRMPSSA